MHRNLKGPFTFKAREAISLINAYEIFQGYFEIASIFAFAFDQCEWPLRNHRNIY